MVSFGSFPTNCKFRFDGTDVISWAGEAGNDSCNTHAVTKVLSKNLPAKVSLLLWVSAEVRRG